ncbi:hypothetical protein [Methylobacterium aquaticum]|uniref:hypothetical protein n=1 Tax=Methylobacterium aquaticum TaxID=270351 RepID=UPI0011AEA724|nr:hypothetical protein [Methylobacterium aquaticum]
MRVDRVGTSTVVSMSDTVLTTGGSGPDFTVTSADGKIRLFDGLSLLLRMDRAGPNAPTLVVDGSPRAPWRDANGSPLADGALQRDSLQRVVYDATRGMFLGTQLGGPGTTGVTPDFTGTLAQRGAYDSQPAGKTFLAVSDLPTGPEWTFYIKQSDTLGDWSAGLAIKASPAQTTVEAQAAADAAAAQKALAAQQAAAAATSQAVAAERAGVSAAQAQIAFTQANAATQSAGEARDIASLVGIQIYDFSFDSAASSSDDWSV